MRTASSRSSSANEGAPKFFSVNIRCTKHAHEGVQANGTPSTVRASEAFSCHRPDGPVGFGTFPVQYTPPADAASVVHIAVAPNGSAQPAILDADDVR